VSHVPPEHVLRDLRIAAGVRQTDLAQVLGKPQSFVSKYESLERRLTFEEVEMISNALRTTMPAFFQHLEAARRDA
jgi:transcriptional regulator with XRE-family HTH domain